MNQENTVSSVHQTGMKNVFLGREDASPRILFIGNSITLHFEAPDIGWNHRWGMAASAEENDYVHRVMAGVRAVYPNADHSIAAQADWERNFWDPENTLMPTFAARDWKPDVVIVRLGENTPPKEFAGHDYVAAVCEMARFYASCGADIIVTDQFWPCEETDSRLMEAARILGAEAVKLSDLGADISNTAAGLFWHGGVACHPGDKGMNAIAERILEKLMPLLARRMAE